MSQLNTLIAIRATIVAALGVLTDMLSVAPKLITVDVRGSNLSNGKIKGNVGRIAGTVNIVDAMKGTPLSDLMAARDKIQLGFQTLVGINDEHGKGRIDSVSIDVEHTDLDAGKIKGIVGRSCGDNRAFSLTVKDSGRVQVRFLEKKLTVN